ncbi:hypothetical protein GCM10023149_28510 [Mucilaginibacter gynuensis]|uniref:Uncharacterized protein n=1 Tax=Mucilaginibacter gynuensis TaxID=1302236 RepID=A0ABP8GKA3_9SPHI
MGYEFTITTEGTVIRNSDTGINVEVREKVKALMPEQTAYCMATQYRINGGFIPEKIFMFRVLPGISLETLKEAVDFFFSDFIKTQLYVKEVPPDSALFPQEALRLYGNHEQAVDSRKADTIHESGTK